MKVENRLRNISTLFRTRCYFDSYIGFFFEI
uniref:Uncharacterized protein n=1 Tax=Myoviridae sp. ct9MV2 TaxID=2826625 RepID=A0A8S5NDJ0_9CAUD|nr:MAG TPA: hypothetical protein [Myoviridae sp. ct9MV2]